VVAAGLDFGKKTDKMVGRRWRGSTLLVAAVQGMDMAAAVVIVSVVGGAWTMLAMAKKTDRLQATSVDEESNLCFEVGGPLCVLSEGASLEEREVPWTMWRA
jgi:hypothetical protein